MADGVNFLRAVTLIYLRYNSKEEFRKRGSLMGRKVVIVGGVAGGASTATRLRRLDEKAAIVLIERGREISYANCGLPYYIGGVIEEREKLFVQSPEALKRRFNITVKTRTEVTRIDREQKIIHLKDLQTGKEEFESYDLLVLATGSKPIMPRIPGIDSPRVFTLRNIKDTDRIKQFIEMNQIQSAVIVGGGFIGLEMMENCNHLGINTTLIERTDQVLNNLDYEMVAPVHRKIRERGVNLILSNGVIGINETERGLEVALEDGTVLNTDLVIMAVGVKPETDLAVAAGLDIGVTGAIKVNDRFQTSDPHIYAVGDAVEVCNIITNQKFWTPLAGPANRQGRLLADILAGREVSYSGVQGTAIVRVFDLDAASTGLNEKTLRSLNIEYLTSITHSNSHATYYPGAKPLTIKLLYRPENGLLLGAQVVGGEGVDKRIDILASAIRFKRTVYDLTELELAYAPQFSSAKDPVNIAGYVATNILDQITATVNWEQFMDRIRSSETMIIDVREPGELRAGKIAGAVNIPLDQIRNRMGEIPKDKEVLIYCQVGQRGYIASRILRQNGYLNVKNLSGGYKTFKLVQNELQENEKKLIKL